MLGSELNLAHHRTHDPVHRLCPGGGKSLFFSAAARDSAIAKADLLAALGFFLTAVAAAVGGTYHGFALYLGDSLRKVLWDTTLYFIGLGSGFMISGTLAASLNRQDESTRWLMAGVLVSLLVLGVQQSGIQIHENLNHNDLYHCIQLGALYLFYWGARLLRDRRKPLGRAIQSPQND